MLRGPRVGAAGPRRAVLALAGEQGQVGRGVWRPRDGRRGARRRRQAAHQPRHVRQGGGRVGGLVEGERAGRAVHPAGAPEGPAVHHQQGAAGGVREVEPHAGVVGAREGRGREGGGEAQVHKRARDRGRLRRGGGRQQLELQAAILPGQRAAGVGHLLHLLHRQDPRGRGRQAGPGHPGDGRVRAEHDQPGQGQRGGHFPAARRRAVHLPRGPGRLVPRQPPRLRPDRGHAPRRPPQGRHRALPHGAPRLPAVCPRLRVRHGQLPHLAAARHRPHPQLQPAPAHPAHRRRRARVLPVPGAGRGDGAGGRGGAGEPGQDVRGRRVEGVRRVRQAEEGRGAQAVAELEGGVRQLVGHRGGGQLQEADPVEDGRPARGKGEDLGVHRKESYNRGIYPHSLTQFQPEITVRGPLRALRGRLRGLRVRRSSPSALPSSPRACRRPRFPRPSFASPRARKSALPARA